MNNLKPSGIEWIGSIPVDWKTVPIYYVAKEVTTKNKTLLRKNAFKFFFGNIINKPNFNPDEDNYVNKTIRNYIIVNPGDIVINGLNLNFDFVTKRVGMVTRPGTITSAYISLRPKANVILPKYMLYILRTYDSEKAFHNMGGGVRKILNYDELSKSKIILPSISAQTRIIKFLDKKVSQIDDISKKIQQEITDLEEYRKSIITKAVTKGLNPNVPMKDSGIPWIGKIPQNWKIIKGKYLFRLLSKPVKKDDQVITCFRDGQVTLRVKRRTTGFTMSDQEIGYQGIDKGDLVVHGMDGFAGAIGISDSRGKGSPVLNVLDSNQDKKYMMYCLRATAQLGVFQALAKGIRVRSADTRWSTLANLKYAIPPQSEQANVVNYLSNNSYKLNAIIQAKKDLVEKLNQYKQSIIYEYVTGKKQVPTEEGVQE
ncbi:MAG: restriction endonuclease subunit S [Ligilactobacillus salivarius]|nr:restriction endonuclease subunit S [Ligilactobacillus salivarius]